MSARRLSDKEQRKYGKRWKIQRSKPAIRSTPPDSPWSAEAVAAHDKTAIARKLPPMIALNLRRIDNGGFLMGVFDLYLPHVHFTFRDCLWFTNGVDAWVRLPTRFWIDQHDQKHYEQTVMVDEVYADRFEHSAFIALGELLDRVEPAGTDAPEPVQRVDPDDDDGVVVNLHEPPF